jgi:hypothetical protein
LRKNGAEKNFSRSDGALEQKGTGKQTAMQNIQGFKIKRLLLLLLACGLLAATVLLIFQNWSHAIPLIFLEWHTASVSEGSVIGLGSLCLGSGLLLLMWVRLLSLDRHAKKTNRELERQEVSREEAVEKVKVLESKIVVLEKALNEALKLKT